MEMPSSGPDRLARILIESHYSIQKGLVKYRAFLPEFYKGAFITSVFDIDMLADHDVWEMGRVHVAEPRGKTVHGHAAVESRTVIALGLSVVRSEPPPRHCDLTGWPNEKQERMNVAQELAATAALKLKT